MKMKTFLKNLTIYREVKFLNNRSHLGKRGLYSYNNYSKKLIINIINILNGVNDK